MKGIEEFILNNNPVEVLEGPKEFEQTEGFKELQRQKFLDFLERTGCLKRNEGGELFFDKEALLRYKKGNKSTVFEHEGQRYSLAPFHVVRELADLEFIDEDGSQKELLSLPKNKASLLTGDFSPGVLDTENITNNWHAEFVLSDGTKTNHLELYIAHLIKEFSVQKDQHGNLTMVDDGEKVPFSFARIEKKRGKPILATRVDEGGSTYRSSIARSSDLVVEQYLQNLGEELLDKETIVRGLMSLLTVMGSRWILAVVSQSQSCWRMSASMRCSQTSVSVAW